MELVKELSEFGLIFWFAGLVLFTIGCYLQDNWRAQWYSDDETYILKNSEKIGEFDGV